MNRLKEALKVQQLQLVLILNQVILLNLAKIFIFYLLEIPTQNRFGNSPSCQQQQSQKKNPQEKIPEKKEFTKVLKKKYEPSRRETETTPPPLRQKPRSSSNLKRTEEKSVSSFTKTKGTRASYEEDDFFEVSEYNEQKALAFRKRKLTVIFWYFTETNLS